MLARRGSLYVGPRATPHPGPQRSYRNCFENGIECEYATTSPGRIEVPCETVDGIDSLRAPAGREPSFVDEIKTKPLAAEAFIVSGYPGMPSSEARSRAHDLSKYINRNGLQQKARPYPWPTETGTVWVVAVYFDGPSDKERVKKALHNLPAEVPDESFISLRASDSWPSSRRIIAE